MAITTEEFPAAAPPFLTIYPRNAAPPRRRAAVNSPFADRIRLAAPPALSRNRKRRPHAPTRSTGTAIRSTDPRNKLPISGRAAPRRASERVRIPHRHRFTILDADFTCRRRRDTARRPEDERALEIRKVVAEINFSPAEVNRAARQMVRGNWCKG